MITVRNDDLAELRSLIVALLTRLDRILARPQKDKGVQAAARWRVGPGGPLSEVGVQEINRRFEAGEADGDIARAMAISFPGVQKRRQIWRRERRDARG